jgi:hypothetical protein
MDTSTKDTRATVGHTLAAPVYHRQRLLLFLLHSAGGRLSKLDLQKLLFLYVQDSGIGHYAFVPYKYGCYSFLARDDMDLMSKRGWLRVERTHVELQSSITGQPWATESEERLNVDRWIRKHELRGDQLIREVYRHYPFYAIRSEMKERLLDNTELERVNEAARATLKSGQTLFTLGYEGIHFEEYANKLLSNGVRLLCDVRRNPLSRKFGFSGRALATLLPKLGIEYLHLPDLGIASEHRKDLDAEGARERLFEAYVRELPEKDHALDRIRTLLREKGPIALTCFEQHPRNCHRHCIAERLAGVHGVEVTHL